MSPRRAILAAASAVAMIIAVLAAAVLGFGRPVSDATPGPSIPAIRTPPIAPPFPSFTIHVDQAVPAETRDPTAHKAQSKLWFAHGAWWAVMTAPERPAITIHRLDPITQTWIDTATLVDERPNANADARWDGERLVIASAVNNSGASAAARIIRFHFDEGSARFVIDSDFPVRISDFGVEGIVVARDSTGVLWVAYMQDAQVYVNHSTDNDAVWARPVALPWPESLASPDDIASLVAFGRGRIGVLWTNQRIGSILLTSRGDGDPDDAWTEPEVALQGRDLADDHLDAKVTADGTLLVAVKTSLDEPDTPNPESPLTVLLERRVDGTWSSHQFGRVRDHHTQPLILVDDRAGIVYMFATSPVVGGTVYVKWSPLGEIEFPAGLGEPFIVGEGGASIADPTSTKDPVDAAEGFVVLAFDKTNGRYVHATVGGATEPAASPWPSDGTIPSTVYLSDTFEPWAVGAAPGNGWELRDPLEGTLTIATDPTHGQIAVLAPSAASSEVRACKPFATLDARPVTVEISAEAGPQSAADVVGLAVRGTGGEIASIRFGQGGTFSYYDGAVKVRSDVPYQPGAWYRIRAVVDQVARSATIQVVDEASGRRVLSAAGLAWRFADAPADVPADVPAADSLCVQVPGGAAGSTLAFDDAVVRQP